VIGVPNYAKRKRDLGNGGGVKEAIEIVEEIELTNES
jgi:hypothetical protein